MRNLGGAIGIALVNTWLQVNTRLQAARLSEGLGQHAQRATQALSELTDRLTAATPDPSQAHVLAEKLFARIVGQQSLAVAFDDVFRLMACIFAAALIMVPFCIGGVRPSAAESH
jgi:DHA2 family multidrug resistance protein